MIKKLQETPDLYVKPGSSALVASSFIYETTVYLRLPTYCSVVNSTYYSSEKEIQNIRAYFRLSPNIEICSELYAAPKEWLIDNGYTLYQKPEKIKRVKKIKENKDVQ